MTKKAEPLQDAGSPARTVVDESGYSRPTDVSQSRERQRSREWMIPAGLVLLSVVPVIAGAARLFELSSVAEVTPENERFFDAPLPILVHIFSVTIYSLLGAFQFAPGLRRRKPGWHRARGRILVLSGLAAALSGLWMTLYYDLPEYDGVALGVIRVLVGSAVVAAILLGVAAVRRRDYLTHGAWMIRAYALALGAGTQVFTFGLFFIFLGEPATTGRFFVMGAGWAINILFAEWVIRTRLR